MQPIQDLYTSHHDWLRNWLRRKLRSDGDAADLAHDTFVRVMASRKLPADLGTEPRALLTHIAKGLVIDRRRRQEVESAYLEALAHQPHAVDISPEERLIIIEALTRIDAMLHELPARTRAMFLMAQLDGLTLQQISEHTNTPVITVRRHISRALMACLSAA